MTKVGHMIEIEVIIRTLRILEAGTTLEMIGIEVNMIEVIAATLRTETGHMTEVEVSIETIEGFSRRDSRCKNRCSSTSEERRCHYCREPGHFIRECQKRNQGKHRDKKHNSNR